MRSLAALTLAVAVAAGVAPWSAVDGPDDLGEPSEGQVSQSIANWAVQNSITYWDLDGSVRELVQEKTEDDVTTITLTSDILFDFASADINEAAEAAIADALADIPDGARVGVGGHTDSVGDASENQQLSEARAKKVAEVVVAARPDLDVTTKGFGEAEPVAANEENGEDNPQGRALNRRVEIIYAAG